MHCTYGIESAAQNPALGFACIVQWGTLAAFDGGAQLSSLLGVHVLLSHTPICRSERRAGVKHYAESEQERSP